MDTYPRLVKEMTIYAEFSLCNEERETVQHILLWKSEAIGRKKLKLFGSTILDTIIFQIIRVLGYILDLITVTWKEMAQ